MSLRNKNLVLNILSLSLLLGSIVITLPLYRHYLLVHYGLDFSSYYNAGQMVAVGKNPYYRNYLLNDQLLFHTHYMYPPIVADIFSIVHWLNLSYFRAKAIWQMLITLLLVATTYLTLLITLQKKVKFWQISILLACSIVSYPIMMEFERAQINFLTLFLILLSFYLWQYKKNQTASGIILALAGILKLPVLLIFILPLIKRDYKFVAAGVMTFLLLISGSILINGKHLEYRYWTNYLPEISKNYLLPATDQDGNTMGIPQPEKNVFVWQNKKYEAMEYFASYQGSAFFYQPIKNVIKPKNINQVAAIVYLILISITFWLIKKGKDLRLTLGLIMSTILAVHPMTWTMNYCWLVFLATMPLILSIQKRKWLVTILSAIIVILASLPEYLIGKSSTIISTLLLQRYSISGILLLVLYSIAVFQLNFDLKTAIITADKQRNKT